MRMRRPELHRLAAFFRVTAEAATFGNTAEASPLTTLSCVSLSTPLRASIIAAVAFLSACAHAPDPQAPVVLKEAQTVEIPVPVAREPPVELMQPLGLTAPGLLPAGQGDYCMTRADTELYIDVLRAAAARIHALQAWAAPGQ